MFKYLTKYSRKLINILNTHNYNQDIIDEILKIYTILQDISDDFPNDYNITANMDKNFCFNFEIFYPSKKNSDEIIKDIKKINSEFTDIILNYKNVYRTITYFNNIDYLDIFKFAEKLYKDIFYFKYYGNFDFRRKCLFLYYNNIFINNLQKLHNLQENKKDTFIDKISNLSIVKEYKFLSFTVHYPGYTGIYIKYSNDPFREENSCSPNFKIKLVEEYRYNYSEL